MRGIFLFVVAVVIVVIVVAWWPAIEAAMNK